MTLLLTRPAADSAPLARILAERGIPTIITPLLDIQYLEAALPPLDPIAALLATSANGIRAFARLSKRRDLPVMAVGDATARTARELGFGVIHTAGGDVNSLAALVIARLSPEGGTLLHMAGSQLAGDLKGLLEARGFSYVRVVLYEARTAQDLPPHVVDGFRSGSLSGVVLFSPRTARCFAQLADRHGLDLHRSTAFCLSAAVAEAVAPCDFAHRIVASRPEQQSLVASILATC